MSVNLVIDKDWKGNDSGVEPYHVDFSISQTTGDVMIAIDAPFFNDPKPPQPQGKVDNLYDYEVVELFISGYSSTYHDECPYLEIEVGPHGHYFLAFFLHEADFDNVDTTIDFENMPRMKIDYEKKRWKCEISVPSFLLPEPMCGEDLSVCWRVNAYAIFGTENNRKYLAHSSVPGSKPNFHQLEYFREIKLFETMEVRDQVDRTISIASEKLKMKSGNSATVNIGGETVFDITQQLRQVVFQEDESGGLDKEDKVDLLTVDQVARQIRDRLLKSNIPSTLLDLEEKFQRQIQADEFVVLHDMVWKRKSLSYRRRKLILTSKPRLFYLDSKGEYRGQVPWTMTKRLKLLKVRFLVLYLSNSCGNYPTFIDQ
jgi:hypothetical protein